MSQLADSQEEILLQLKQKGPQSARALAEILAITPMGIRQHLAILAEKGLVSEGAEHKQGRGRPVRPWQLTEKGHSRFPDAHSQVSVELIAAVRDTFGEDGLDRLIARRTDQTLANYRQALAQHETLPTKLRKLAEIRSREGYMAEVERVDKGEWLLLENHCPICAAAKACQGFCRSELQSFQELLREQATVERTDHILQGARRCAYRIVKK
ncbi:transcriptional regulator [Proteobacteria bacterium 005FR1]|nr:transcriptional regulator [Proteobacteria bacterium 005FR1]